MWYENKKDSFFTVRLGLISHMIYSKSIVKSPNNLLCIYKNHQTSAKKTSLAVALDCSTWNPCFHRNLQENLPANTCAIDDSHDILSRIHPILVHLWNIGPLFAFTSKTAVDHQNHRAIYNIWQKGTFHHLYKQSRVYISSQSPQPSAPFILSCNRPNTGRQPGQYKHNFAHDDGPSVKSIQNHQCVEMFHVRMDQKIGST